MAERQRRVVVITGGSAGAGRAAAEAFARRGDSVAVLARGKARLEDTRRDIESLGSQAFTASVDVADADAVEQAAGEIEEQLGPIDVWVNNAMTSVFSPVRQMEAAEFRRVTEVTYLGVVHGTLSALKRMLPRDRGRIVQVGSALAYRAIPLQSAYCAAKHAIQGFTEALRSELIHDHSRVSVAMVQMPALNTPQFRWVKSRLPNKAQPVPPIFQPEVAANAILFAADSNRSEIYVGMPSVKAIAGDRIMPRLLDHYLARVGYDSQMTNEPEDPDRPDNLWQPVEGHQGAHGVFDLRAKPHSGQLWANEHRGRLALAGLALAGVAVGAALWRD
ncbi:MAG TPA: SDR family oxidoreductase [Gemmatimonadales bacterium]|nr:SDR family oxidoreductase [Gemmatimonadales bacterium]